MEHIFNHYTPNAEGLCQSDLGCWTGRKTTTRVILDRVLGIATCKGLNPHRGDCLWLDAALVFESSDTSTLVTQWGTWQVYILPWSVIAFAGFVKSDKIATESLSEMHPS